MVEGNIIQLQSEAMAFCFKHLNLSGVVRGLYREEELEVPADALREAIINALAHRLYTSSGSVSLAIYEDRVEISNPGNFNPEVAAQGAFPGMASTPRNPTIAKVLYLRKSIEMWGRGIGLIVNACEKARSAAPKIYEDHGFIYTVFTRPTAQEWQNKVGEVNPPSVCTDKVDGTLKSTLKSTPKSTLNSTDRKIVELLAADGRISMVAISTRIGLSREGVRKAIKRLKDSRIIQRIGPAKGGHWEVGS